MLRYLSRYLIHGSISYLVDVICLDPLVKQVVETVQEFFRINV
jgi:hypothetical protein